MCVRVAAVLMMVLTARPVLAQVNLAGTWTNRVHEDFMERAPGPTIGDMTGTVDRPPHTIWLDGRPHPSKNALHSFGGFTTGGWEGNALLARTTHLKEGMVWRNGVPHSDQATMTEHYVRHGDILTITMIVEDPIYFEEPFIRNTSFVLDPNARVLPEPCEPQAEFDRAPGEVPHYLPGLNPFLNEVSRVFNIPDDAARGGAATMYPEYRKQLVGKYTPLERCLRNCCGGAPGLNCDAPRDEGSQTPVR
ncbi:MAG TPA: hypothetical protein VH702_04470, partial [Vicinamibacterales bacterium]|jgi:hypothetical protein